MSTEGWSAVKGIRIHFYDVFSFISPSMIGPKKQ